jgi:NACHT domain
MSFAMIHPKIDARYGTFNHISGDSYHQYITPDRLECKFHPDTDLYSNLISETPAHILQKLQPACMDASDRAECLPGTRVATIQLITDWALDPATTQNTLWVHGLAGIGKSTLSTTVANRFLEMGRLGAFVFFSRDVAERSNPATVIRTLAYQIGSLHPRASAAICTAIEKFPGICLSPLSVQFQKLLVEPLASVIDKDAAPGTLVLVIDALDECGTPKTRQALLEVLTEKLIQLPSSIRILITSRSEHDICCEFRFREQFLEQKLNIMSGFNTNDISLYLKHRMARVRSKMMIISPGTQWPSQNDLTRLAHRASGLFVWASTASEFIDGYDPPNRMDIVLNGAVKWRAEEALDVLYRTALESSENWDDEDFLADFTAIMELVLVARHPLSSTAIDLLLCTPRRPCSYTISHLGCVLQQTPIVRPLHPSFSDFLTSRSRCGRDIWFFDRNPCKLKLVILCLRRLNRVLRQNMCNLTLSVDQAQETLPEDVKYACVFWIEHICTIQDGIPSVMAYLDVFVNEHLLHWIEAMSILKKSRNAIGLLDDLLAWMKVCLWAFCFGVNSLNIIFTEKLLRFRNSP